MNVSAEGEITLDETVYVSADRSSLRLENDNVLFTNTSSTTWVGKSSVVRGVDGEWGFSNHMTRIRLCDQVSPEFVARQLHYLCLSGYFASLSTKHINQSSISNTQLATIPFRLAPAAEQKRIASVLTSLIGQERIIDSTLRSLSSIVQECRTAVFAFGATGKLLPRRRHPKKQAEETSKQIGRQRRDLWEAEQLARFESSSIVPESDAWKDRYDPAVEPEGSLSYPVPRGWLVASLDQCGQVRLGRMRSPRNRAKDYPRPYVRAGNITEDGLDLTSLNWMDFPPDELVRYRLIAGDLLLTEASGSSRHVGKPAVWRDEVADCCFQNTVIRLRPVATISSEFLYVVLQHLFRSGIFAETASGTGINHLSAERFARIPVAIPPPEEQERIVLEVNRRLKVLDELNEAIESTLAEMRTLKLSFYHRAFSGDLVRPNNKDESAEQLLTKMGQEISDSIATKKRVRKERLPKQRKKRMRNQKRMHEVSDAYLSRILREHGRPLDARSLWKESELSIDDFYAQLKREIDRHVRITDQQFLEAVDAH